ncbi:MAG: TlpA family protein disulfide reductase [Acidobacteria bacterium]|nr:TlpA family protein disulfide reductase [Acidobacteriota bacterium]MBV9923828.1 TlpA family protein disulfide reductase [Acidobacteriota bacterium]
MMRLHGRTAFALPLLLLLAAAGARAQGTAAPAANGDGFRLKGLDGKFYDTAEMKGDVLVVSFGSTSCVPCFYEHMAIEELKVEYTGKPVRFLWVSVESPKEVSNNVLRYYVKERRITVPVLRDPGGVALAQYEKTGNRVPVVVFFDAEGRPSGKAQQGMPQDITVYKQLVRERVNALLAARPAAGAGGR